MFSIVKSLFAAGVDIIYPSFCPVCHVRLDSGDDTLCGECWDSLRELISLPSCSFCGKTAAKYETFNGRCHECQGLKSQLDYIIRVGAYQSPLKELLWQLKYCGQSSLDRFLGGLAADTATIRPEFRELDYLVPIPLHWRRRLRRGYNQSELLAEAIARKLTMSGMPRKLNFDLVRIRNTPPQTTLSEARRRANLAGAFALRPDHKFSGGKICLIDDVTTTGTTLETAARVLRRAGASSVGALVIMVP